MDFIEYFEKHPCRSCYNAYEHCSKILNCLDSDISMLIYRLEHIIVDGDCDCWEKRDYDNGF